jgi:hypothetical protein
MKEKLWMELKVRVISLHIFVKLLASHTMPHRTRAIMISNITKQLYEGNKMRGIHKYRYFSDRRYLQQNRNKTDGPATAL